MASRYVPPHLRGNPTASDGKTTNSSGNNASTGLARRRLSDLKIASSDECEFHTIRELNHHYGSSLTYSTLRNSAAKPNQLGYVVLFRGANPKWASDQIVFAHTNIHILPGYNDFKQDVQEKKSQPSKDAVNHTDGEWEIVSEQDLDEAPTPVPSKAKKNEAVGTITSPDNVSAATQPGQPRPTIPILSYPVPVFMQMMGTQTGRTFAFHGYFHLSKIDFLKPHSPELVRMLQLKWEAPQTRYSRGARSSHPRERTRNPEAWAQSLKEEWAVLKFEKVPKEKAQEQPKIEILPDEELDVKKDGLMVKETETEVDVIVD